jgi:hypothetical protein
VALPANAGRVACTLMVGQRWVVIVLVVLGLILGIAIAGFPSRGTSPAVVPVITDGLVTTTTLVYDSGVPTIPPRSNLPNSVLSATTSTTR